MTPCIEFSGAKDRSGYGRVGKTSYRTSTMAHRLAYEAEFGVIPAGLEVRHMCDNPPCVNPEHLELGTHAQNMKDMSVRKRAPSGSRNGHAKLSDEDVRQMRCLMAIGVTGQWCVRTFGVGKNAVSSIKTGAAWKSE